MASGKQVIFVFGSNLAGKHGKGAAKFARENYGAEYGIGAGMTGNSYAIPTKDENLKTIPLWTIEESVEIFRDYAKDNQQYIFILTPIGTGLAGHGKRDVWSMIKRVGMPSNVVLSSTWLD